MHHRKIYVLLWSLVNVAVKTFCVNLEKNLTFMLDITELDFQNLEIFSVEYDFLLILRP